MGCDFHKIKARHTHAEVSRSGVQGSGCSFGLVMWSEMKPAALMCVFALEDCPPSATASSKHNVFTATVGGCTLGDVSSTSASSLVHRHKVLERMESLEVQLLL